MVEAILWSITIDHVTSVTVTSGTGLTSYGVGTFLCPTLFLSGAGGNLLTVLVPSVDPCPLSASECIASGRKDFTNATYAECMQPFPVYIKGGVERCPLLDDIEG